MRTARLGRFTAALFVLLCLSTPMWGQALGNIVGTVEDVSGAVIPAATVTVTNEATGISVEVQSQADGRYYASSLLPGTYKISVQIEGFKSFEISGLRLNVGSTLNQTIVLEVGVVTESIEVTGESMAVQTTSGEVSATIQVEQILEMPMPTRNVFALVNLVPGVFANNTGNDQEPRISIGGGRTQSALAMLDGTQNSRGGLGVQNVEMSPPIDSMQEFKVEVNNMGAQYGRSSAGLINAMTKSGTNEYHGSGYWFVRNDAFDARAWGADTKAPLRRNNFGGTIGGPIKKNKIFFFYNYDSIINRRSVVRTSAVGLPGFQQGDFSNATAKIGGAKKVVPIHDPNSGSGTFAKPKNTTPFPGNIIPRDRFDPVSAQMLAGNYWPGANRTPNNAFNNAGNYQENVPNKLDRDYHTLRGDFELATNTRMYARLIFTNPDDALTGYSQGFGEADRFGLDIINRRTNAVLNITHLFSPMFILNATVGFGRVTVDRKSGDCCETNYAQQFGLPEVSRVGGEVFPRINGITGGLVPMQLIGAVGNAHRFAAFNNFDYDFQFTKMQGSHTFKFGFKFSAYQGNELSRPQPSGQWNFNERFSKGYNAKGKAIGGTGIRFADFILGRLNTVNARVAPSIGKRIKYYSGYFQDDWKVTSNLTFNIGVRYETETPITEVGDR
ncbi:MAG: TonB-dependent receptor plug domain-containing protein, partial [bacterium]|nr:TonB-dependent receptor plug domain-containing protein [bacterium]